MMEQRMSDEELQTWCSLFADDERAEGKTAAERAFFDLRDSRAEAERLRAMFNEDNAACLCGCTLDEHEGHGEDGEFCEHEDHVCIRVCVAAAEVHAKLRARVEELELAYGLIDLEKEHLRLCVEETDVLLAAARASLAHAEDRLKTVEPVVEAAKRLVTTYALVTDEMTTNLEIERLAVCVESLRAAQHDEGREA